MAEPRAYARLLAIETSGPVASVALSLLGDESAGAGASGSQERVFSAQGDGELRHLSCLLPLVRTVLDAAGSELSELDALAVSAGPGSFTGIRIGVSTVRALCQATGLMPISVPTLETFVYHVQRQSGGIAVGKGPAPIVCPVFDARRSQMYAGAYRLSAGIETLVPGAAHDPGDFLEALKGAACPAPILFCGDGLPVFKDQIQDALGGLPFALHPELGREAENVLRWARAFGRATDYRRLEPVYMRKAEAQRKLDERRAAERSEAGQEG
jgi:tRNA threonylcarbamoyladenosine biosynthesis protein TsaB